MPSQGSGDAASSIGLESLPVEIIQAICKEFCSHCSVLPVAGINFPLDLKSWVRHTRGKPLYNLCLTSQRLRRVAQPIFFHHFHHSTLDLEVKMVPFARVIEENPHLASHVRCITWAKPVRRRFQGRLRDEMAEGARFQELYHPLLLRIISLTPNLSALDVQIEPSLITTPIQLPALRFMALSLCLDVIGLDSTVDRRVSDLFEAPNVAKLSLSNWVSNGSSCQGIVDSMRQLDNIDIDFRSARTGSETEDFGAFARGLPNLTAIILQTAARTDEFLSQFLPAKSRLASLVVSSVTIDFGLLIQFEVLERICITGHIQGIPFDDDETVDIALPPGLPASIRFVTLREASDDKLPMARFLRRLSYQTSKYRHLKSVNIDSVLQMDEYNHLVRENLKRAGVSPTSMYPVAR